MERHRDLHGSLQLLRVLNDLVRSHGAGGIHDGDLVEACRLQLLRLFRQLVRRQKVRLHKRIERLQTGFLDLLHRLDGDIGIARVRAHAEEGKAVFLRLQDVVAAIALRVQEHADFGAAVQIFLHDLKVGIIRFRLGEARHLVGADAAGIAELDDRHARRRQAVQYHIGDLGVKALADHICSVSQGAVH